MSDLSNTELAEKVRKPLDEVGYGMFGGSHQGQWVDKPSVAGDGWVSVFLHKPDCEVCAAKAALVVLLARLDVVTRERDDYKAALETIASRKVWSIAWHSDTATSALRAAATEEEA